MKDMTKNILLWVVIAFALLSMFNYFGPRNKPDTAMTYTNFIAAINQGTIRQVSMDGEIISGMMTDGDRFLTYNPGDPHLIDELSRGNNVALTP
jgi:cell division protease FtsH